jgi:hypothetical protein
VKREVLGACALLAVAGLLGASAGAATKPQPKAPATVPYDCAKLLPVSKLVALSSGTFTLTYSKSIPAAGFSTCAYNGTAQPGEDAVPADAVHPDVAWHIISGTSKVAKAQIARDWKVYSQPAGGGKCGTPAPGATPRDPRDCDVQQLSGFGDRAAEFNDYIVVQKGSSIFQIWAGNNGMHHLSYDQLETVAKYLLTKIK